MAEDAELQQDPHQSNSSIQTTSVLERGFDVLDAFRGGPQTLTFAQIARRSRLPKSTAHRIIGMLLLTGALERQGAAYQLGMRIFALGVESAESRLRSRALPVLQELHRRSRQPVHLAVLRQTNVVYLEKLTAAGSISTPAKIGQPLPAHCTAIGKSLMAAEHDWDRPRAQLSPLTRNSITDPGDIRGTLSVIRTRGFAVDRGESLESLACLAAPVYLHGSAVAAVSVSFPVGDGSGEALVPMVREASTRIGRVLSRTLAAGVTRTSGSTATDHAAFVVEKAAYAPQLDEPAVSNGAGRRGHRRLQA
ncbi:MULTISPECIES: IclR family transcriptional regulator [unclassified Mycobacterium]|uniref:IclR family transcriptional regulator n=1 Tax=unclassified Mycobacterium TaxID=2642494 RepID=UPI0029C6B6A4|nr:MULTISPECIES: IclR family transcriptional regulator [unclassified Mycobacterium]